jgi:hypothetical protein
MKRDDIGRIRSAVSPKKRRHTVSSLRFQNAIGAEGALPVLQGVSGESLRSISLNGFHETAQRFR